MRSSCTHSRDRSADWSTYDHGVRLGDDPEGGAPDPRRDPAAAIRPPDVPAGARRGLGRRPARPSWRGSAASSATSATPTCCSSGSRRGVETLPEVERAAAAVLLDGLRDARDPPSGGAARGDDVAPVPRVAGPTGGRQPGARSCATSTRRIPAAGRAGSPAGRGSGCDGRSAHCPSTRRTSSCTRCASGPSTRGTRWRRSRPISPRRVARLAAADQRSPGRARRAARRDRRRRLAPCRGGRPRRARRGVRRPACSPAGSSSTAHVDGPSGAGRGVARAASPPTSSDRTDDTPGSRGYRRPVRVEVEPGVRLFFDVVGAALAPTDDARWCAKPTLLLLHGGPGLRPLLVPPVLRPLRRHPPGRVPRPARAGSQRRARRPGGLDVRRLGRRRRPVLRRARHRGTGGARELVRRLRRHALRRPPPRPRVEAGALEHPGPPSRRRDRGPLRGARRPRGTRLLPAGLRRRADARGRRRVLRTLHPALQPDAGAVPARALDPQLRDAGRLDALVPTATTSATTSPGSRSRRSCSPARTTR